MSEGPAQRVSPIRPPEAYVLPSRAEAPQSQDAFRQTQFMLGSDLDLFAEAMNLQLRVAHDAYPSQYRTHPLAAQMALWSRTYTYLADAALLTMRGSYAAVLPLVRSACEGISAGLALRGEEDAGAWDAWLTETMRPNTEHKAFEFALGRFWSGTLLHDDAVLNSIYRPVSELARPSFGATLLQVGSESSNVRIAINFADPAFHLGWAELAFGWLLALAARQVRLAVDANEVFPISEELRSAYVSLQEKVDSASSRGDRCRIEEVDEGGDRRLVVHNFRRSTNGTPRRILL